MKENSGKTSDINGKECSEVRRRLLKLAAYVPPAIMGAALFDIPSAVASGDDKENDREGGKRRKKGGRESCAPHVCKPHRRCKPRRHGDEGKDKDS